MPDINRLKNMIAHFPDFPGVYLMRGAQGEVIYIGKAKSLKKRLVSYFGRDLSSKTAALMFCVTDIEYRLTASESLALILEAGLVRKHKPKYNVALRDDKSFPWIKITNAEFPLVCISRKKDDAGTRYFGPYTNAGLLRSALKIIRQAFAYRSCGKLPRRACLYYRLNLCPAPCVDKVTKKEYKKNIDNIVMILEGRDENLVKSLTHEMTKKSRELKFEEAARLRDKIVALGSLSPESINNKGALVELKKILRLKNIPRRLEAFDVSNISGKSAAASMVSFWDGQPDKNNYRRFKIKTVSGSDDYAMLSEAVFRRYRRLKEENLSLPDLILIDGGKGQLSSAQAALESLDLSLPVIGLAKKEEEIYTVFKEEPLRLPRSSPVLRLLQYIRDEAHRFAHKYHQVLRKKKILGLK